MKELIEGMPDRKTVVLVVSVSLYGGNMYSKLLLNFTVRLIGTSLMKKGPLL
jgi:hypothetical protein